MSDPYDSHEYRRQAGQAKGDAQWTLWRIVVPVGLFAIGVGLILWFGGFFAGNAQEAAVVAQKEFGAQALLKKYEWFKSSGAQLDKKQADIKVYASRLSAMDQTYKGTPRKDWPRTDLEQYNVWQSEVAGVKASFNQLAAEYNAQMAKANWAFANAGKLPTGADTPLPRDYKPYETE